LPMKRRPCSPTPTHPAGAKRASGWLKIIGARENNLKNLDVEIPLGLFICVTGASGSGKSSLINALMGEEVCEVAPGPCTAGIRELVYGGERNIINLGPFRERICLPKEVLREVTMVDTPGTNSIIQNHEAITENYIPQSDLVVFTFSAPNPHTKSAWELLTVIKKDWYRKMVFILQQSDRASQRELTVNRDHVIQYARDRQVDNPTVFALSAKRDEIT